MKSAVWFITMNCQFNCPYCSPEGSLILMGDLSYKKIEDIRINDEIIGFKKGENGKHLRFFKSKVLSIGNRVADCNKIYLDNGKDVECSIDHHWWNGRSYQIAYNGMDMLFTSSPISVEETKEFMLGYIKGAFDGDGCLFKRNKKGYNDYQSLLRCCDEEIIDRTKKYLNYFNIEMKKFSYFNNGKIMFGIRSFKKDVFTFLKEDNFLELNDEYRRGWLSGMYDAEGSLSDVISIAQKKKRQKHYIKYCLFLFGFDLKESKERNGVSHFRILKKREQLRFIALVNPSIIRKRNILKLGNISIRTKVSHIIPSGNKKVYSLTTESGNYIVNGFLSKNCWERQRQTRGEFHPEPFIDYKKWVTAWNKLNFDVIDITGGEPFMQPNFIEMINEMNGSIAITTNAYVDLCEFVQKVSPKKVFSMTVSFHPTQRLNINHFSGKLLLLKHRGFNITVNIVAYPEQMLMIPYYRQHFINMGFQVHIDPYSQTEYQPFEFTVPESNFIKANTGEDRLHSFNKELRPVNCSAGIDHLTVFPSGIAYRCINDKIGDKPAVGNILDENFNLLPSWEYCEDYNKCAGCNKDKVQVENARCLT